MARDLIEIFGAQSGLVCLVGAGGKKTTVYRLAAAHPGSVGVTSTVHIPPFPKTLEAHVVIAHSDDLVAAVVDAASQHRVIAFAQPSIKYGRFAGLEPSRITEIHHHAGFEVTLIKADGARSRWIKAPNADEPQLPNGVTTVIPVVSARVIGHPLSERLAHRVDRVAAITGVRAGEPITPMHVARLLTHAEGALKAVGLARVVPLINMVDDAERQRLAREVAEQALALSERFDHVVLACMRRADPIVDIVAR